MTQVQTNSTLEITDALEEIDNNGKAAELSHDDTTVYVRSTGVDGSQFNYLLSVFVEVLADRRTITVRDEETIRKAMATADTAEVVQISNTPWADVDHSDTNTDQKENPDR